MTTINKTEVSYSDVLSNSLSLSQLRGLKPTDPVWVLNTSENVTDQRSDVFIAIRQSDGRTDVIEIPLTWLPIDITQHAPQEAILKSSHFIDAIRSEIIVPITNDYAETLLNRPTSKQEAQRLKAKDAQVKAAVAANGIGRNVTISNGDDDDFDETQDLLNKVNGKGSRVINVSDIDNPDLDLFPNISPSFKAWVDKNNALSEEGAINDLKLRGKLSGDEAEYYLEKSDHDRIRTFLKSQLK